MAPVSKLAALRELRKLKKNGGRRMADYEVQEEGKVYEEVDEETYAALAAEKRREARDFLAGDEDESDMEVDDDLEAEFAFEEEMSVMRRDGKTSTGKGRGKRKRRPSAQGRKRLNLGQPAPKRVSAAFFRSVDATGGRTLGGLGGEPLGKSVLDEDFLTKQLDSHVKAKKKARKSKAKAKAVLENALFMEPQMENIQRKLNFDDEPSDDQPIEPQPIDEQPGSSSALQGRRSLKDGQKTTDMFDVHAAGILPMPSSNSDEVQPGSTKEHFEVGGGDAPAPMEIEPVGFDDQKDPPCPQPVPVNMSAVAPSGKLARTAEGDVLMFWTDCQEVKINGGEDVYLFGKAALNKLDSGVYTSICVKVEGLERSLYVLPRVHEVDRHGNPTDKKVSIIPDVHKEVLDLLRGDQKKQGSAMASRLGTNTPKTIKAKMVTRCCPFPDDDAPREPTSYLMVKFGYAHSLSLTPLTTGCTFSRVYGTKASSVEALVVQCNLKGPGWIRIKNPSVVNRRLSHAKHTLRVSSPVAINVETKMSSAVAPTISALCLSVKTTLNSRDGAHEIIAISGVFIPNVPVNTHLDSSSLDEGSTKDFTLLRPMHGRSLPFGFAERARAEGLGVEVAANEYALLNCFVSKLVRLDPDSLLGHDLLGFGLDVILARMKHLQIRQWSRLGRLNQRQNRFKGNSMFNRWMKEKAVAGRLVCDTYLSSKELLPRETNYSLPALADTVLKLPNALPKRLTEVAMVPKVLELSETLLRFLQESSTEARIAGRIAAHLSILPLTKQLTCLSGNTWARTLGGARAERIEFLLCHEFSKIGEQSAGAGMVNEKILLVDKLSKPEKAALNERYAKRNGTSVEEAEKSSSKRRKPKYAGGLVLDPVRGLYDRYVLQLDFNSLYPSIIQEYNICFTTIDGNAKDDQGTYALLPGRTVAEGILPKVLRRLVEQRRSVKSVLKAETDPLRASQLELRQLAIKLTANSLYGCLGFEGSRFASRPLAELVTSQGRETLQATVDLARDSFAAQVIYGDTDSIFVYTGLNDIKQVRSLGIDLKREVNKKYKTLEIEIDAIYSKMLLLKKKKYAALKVVNPLRPSITSREVKGLDLVRHDWCPLSHDASNHFLNQLFSRTGNVEEAVGKVIVFLENLAKSVKEGAVDLQKYVITKSLTKKIEEYPDGKNLPHVQVAQRLRKTKDRTFAPGDYIQYVICKSRSDAALSNASFAQRAFHPEEVKASDGDLIVDAQYYLENQVLPPVLRLGDPIESVEATRLAAALGLDERRYRSYGMSNQESDAVALGPADSEADRYKDCEPFVLQCHGCQKQFDFVGVTFSRQTKTLKSAGLECIHCNKPIHPPHIVNKMTKTVRGWQRQYYCSSYTWTVDGGRTKETRSIRLGGAPPRRKFDGSWMYTQLRFLRWLMDAESKWHEVGGEGPTPLPREVKGTYETLLQHADMALEVNAFRFVDLSKFLAPLGLT